MWKDIQLKWLPIPSLIICQLNKPQSAHLEKNAKPGNIFQASLLLEIHVIVSELNISRDINYEIVITDNLSITIKIECVHLILIFNPYPRFFGTITERHFWKKIQNHHW